MNSSDSNVLSLLKELISRPSVTPNDAGCQKVVADRLVAAGFEVTDMPFEEVSNLWATHGSGSPLLCFAGHTDVVPTGPIDAWTSPPFEPTEREGRLFGRGASDMKASDAAMVCALEALASRGHSGTVAFLLTSDEEGPGVNGTVRVLETLLGQGVPFEGVLVGEPTSERVFGDTVKAGRRGSAHGTLVVSGVQGHTAFPHLADNAVHRLAPTLSDLVAIDWGRGTDEFPPTTLQVSNLTAGTGAGNVIPGTAQVEFNVRFGTDWTVETIVAKVEEVVGGVGTVKWGVSALPFLTEPGSLLDSLSSAIESVTGVVPKLGTGGGTSDARFFAAKGIPVAEFGPSNASIHAIDENVVIEDLAKLVDIYFGFAQRFLNDS